MTGSLPRHGEAAAGHRWRPERVYTRRRDWEADIDRCRDAIPIAASYRGRLREGPAVLAELRAHADALLARVDRVALYARLAHEAETTNPQARAMLETATQIRATAGAALAFVEPELIEVGIDTVRGWIDGEPALAQLAHHLQRIEDSRTHLRGTEIETLLAAVAEPFGVARRTLGALAYADLSYAPAVDGRGRRIAVDQASESRLLRDADRELRRTTWRSVTDAWLGSRNAFAQCVAAIAHQDVFMRRARGYGSALEASLAAERIDVAIYHNVIDAYHDNAHVWRRYFRLRRRALGYARLQPYDLDVPLPGAQTTVPYQDALQMVLDAVRPLGEEYVTTLRAGVADGGWIDVYPTAGKHPGAQVLTAYGVEPFVLLNYADDMISASILAHELGHAMHSLLAQRAQPYVYSGQATFVAETASNVHQALLRRHLLTTARDRTLRLAILDEALFAFRRYLLNMPVLAATELRAREQVERGLPITAESLGDWTCELKSLAYGDEVALDRERDGIAWATSPPLVMAGFYAYQYATGIAAAYALLDGLVRSEAAAQRYVRMLEAGCSDYAPELVRHAGADLTTRQPLDQAYAHISALVDELEDAL